MKPNTAGELIECTIWRTMKILGAFSKAELHAYVAMTHKVGRVKIGSYVNTLLRHSLLRKAGDGRFCLAANAPAAAPIYRQLGRAKRAAAKTAKPIKPKQAKVAPPAQGKGVDFMISGWGAKGV